MATIYTRKDINGKRYYINIVVGKNRIRRFAGYSLEVAKANLKKLEYDLTFNQIDEQRSYSFDKSLSSYMDYINTTSIKDKQVKVIQSKNTMFKDYCKNKGVKLLKDVKSQHALTYISMRSQVKVQSDWQKRECLKQVQSVFDSEFIRANNINLHTFRHTYSHNMLNKGVPKEVLQTLLGHRSIKTTEIYANWVKTKELEKWVE